MTLEEARAACKAAGVDTRISGQGLTACMDRIVPFCGGRGVTSEAPDGIPACLAPSEPFSARKAAIIAAEVQSRQRALARDAAGGDPPWLLLGGVAAAVVVAVLVTR